MVQEGVERFAEPTTNVVILVAGEPDVPPQFTAQPADATVLEGQGAAFTVAATGSPAPTLQWQVRPAGALDFADLPGATTVTFTTPALTLADIGVQFRCIASNAAGVATSAAATVTVISGAPSFVLQPTNQTVRVGQTASFTVALAPPSRARRRRPCNGSGWRPGVGHSMTYPARRRKRTPRRNSRRRTTARSSAASPPTRLVSSSAAPRR